LGIDERAHGAETTNRTAYFEEKMAGKMELHCIWTVHAYIELNSTTLQQKQFKLAKFELKSAVTAI
jgi:hypothetical protein